jgi:predicted ATPase/class 3 adenylate cyclase
MPALPRGTVTFLFTDIEASTSRWEHDPAAMRDDLARHDAILRRAIEGQSGAVFKTVGDAFYAVFPAAINALAAALMAQRNISAERWTGATPLRVRMALHTGEADVRDHDYFGPALARVARLLSVAHGGQILLTSSVEALAHDRLPAHVSLRDLGEHRLRDLSRRERIFQLVASGIPTDFPPIRTPNARPTNLTTPPTPLIGRDQEIQTARDRVTRDGVRLLTLTGPGGTGKTRLAMEIAADLADAFGDGVFFVPLEAVSDAEFVPAAMARALGVREAQGRPVDDVLTEYLRDMEILILLDNFEQVMDAAPFVANLLARCPHVALLVTSRERLRLRGEQEMPVPPLAVKPEPPVDQRHPATNRTTPEAMQLFVERAREVRPGFGLTDETVTTVQQICERLDGLPLAIELAAAHIRMLSPAALLQRLGATDPPSLHLLQSGARDLPARQQTLWNTIDWSYHLLSPDEQSAFRCLSIFAGGCTMQAATAICDDLTPPTPLPSQGRGEQSQPRRASISSVSTEPIPHQPSPDRTPPSLRGKGVGGLGNVPLPLFTSLVDKSLVQVDETADGEPRLRLLETIRAYGLEQLQLHGEFDAAQRAHAAFVLRFVEAADTGLGTAQARWWRAQLEDEQENIRAALRWACDNDEVEVAARLVQALHQHWFIGGWLSEGLWWCSDLLARPRLAEHPVLHASVLFVGGRLAGYQGDQQTAGAWLEESIALSRAAGDRLALARALAAYGRLLIEQPERAQPALDESIRLLRELNDRRWLASALGYLGAVARRSGDIDTAQSVFEESLALTHETGDPWAAAAPLTNLAALIDRQGDLATARSMYEESLHLCRDMGVNINTVSVLNSLALLLVRTNEPDQAANLLSEGLDLCRRLGARGFAVESAQILAWVPFLKGRPDASARLLAAAEAAQEALGKELPATHTGLYRSGIEMIRRALGDAAFTAAWREGRSQSLDDAVAHALAPPEVSLVEA